jgi:hypothetical protein
MHVVGFSQRVFENHHRKSFRIDLRQLSQVPGEFLFPIGGRDPGYSPNAFFPNPIFPTFHGFRKNPNTEGKRHLGTGVKRRIAASNRKKIALGGNSSRSSFQFPQRFAANGVDHSSAANQ